MKTLQPKPDNSNKQQQSIFATYIGLVWDPKRILQEFFSFSLQPWICSYGGVEYSKIQQAIGPHEDLLTIVKRRNLQWDGHVSRSSGLTKTILQGTVKRGRRQGRQRKRWEDKIREWTCLEFGKSQRPVENREKWRKLVTKSSVVPKRSSRLRD